MGIESCVRVEESRGEIKGKVKDFERIDNGKLRENWKCRGKSMTSQRMRLVERIFLKCMEKLMNWMVLILFV